MYSARNTLTHRIQGPTSTATVVLDVSPMHDSDHSGLAILRDRSAYIGVKREGTKNKIIFVDQINMDLNWKTIGMGKEMAVTDLAGSRVWLRCQADIHPGAGKLAHFSYRYYCLSESNFTENKSRPRLTINNREKGYQILNYRNLI